MFLKEKIKEARLEKKMTQKQLAEELTLLGRKTSNTAIANWESGLNSPDVDTLQLICKILDKDGNYFFSQDTNNNNFKYASNNGLDTEGLTDEEIEELKEFIRFKKSLKKKKD